MQLSRRMLAAAGLGMLAADNRDDFDPRFLKPSAISMGPLHHWTKHKAQSFGESQFEECVRQSADVFEEHGLALAVGSDNEIVEAEREFHDGVESRKRPVARPHLFDQNAAVARSEQMHHPASQDGVGEPIGGLGDGGRLPFDAGDQLALLKYAALDSPTLLRIRRGRHIRSGRRFGHPALLNTPLSF